MLEQFSLQGEIALISGGGSGIGFGIASCFLKAGARVVITGRREDRLIAAVDQLGSGASWRVHDVSRPEENEALVANVAETVGEVTILVNNAGNHVKKPTVECSPEEFDAVLQTHVGGAFSLSRSALPAMMKRRKGNILFVASMASFFGLPRVLAYAAAKSAYLGMVRSLAVEVSPMGVRVNAVAPGWIESDMMRAALSGDPDREKKILGRTPLNCFGRAEDIGLAATYLCSPAARFVTGVVLPVDGGASIGF